MIKIYSYDKIIHSLGEVHVAFSLAPMYCHTFQTISGKVHINKYEFNYSWQGPQFLSTYTICAYVLTHKQCYVVSQSLHANTNETCAQFATLELWQMITNHSSTFYSYTVCVFLMDAWLLHNTLHIKAIKFGMD